MLKNDITVYNMSSVGAELKDNGLGDNGTNIFSTVSVKPSAAIKDDSASSNYPNDRRVCPDGAGAKQPLVLRKSMRRKG